MDEEIFKEEVLVDDHLSLLTLHSSGLLLCHRHPHHPQQGQQQHQQPQKQVLVLRVHEDLLGLRRSTSGTKLHLSSFTRTEGSLWCAKGTPGRKRKDVVLEFDSDVACAGCEQAVQRVLDESGRPKRLYVLVNPFGGGGAGKKVYTTVVEPLLKVAGIAITMQETQYQRHAKELAKSLDISQFDGIVCVSGDGVLVEVLNGLLERPDWENAIKIPLGIIPAGTSNGMAKSLLDYVGEPCNATSATFLVIRGQKQPLDVATAKQADAKFHSILMMAWGLVADVDFESEVCRWMGSYRIDFYALIRICNLRKYVGHIYYIPAPGHEGTGVTFSSGELEGSTGLLKSYEPGSTGEAGSSPRPFPATNSAQGQWRSMEGPFVNVWLNNVPFVDENVKPAPHAQFSDGYLDLVIMRDCPRWALICLLTKLQSGEHIKSNYVEYLKVKAFRLDPGGRYQSDIQGGYVDMDGEVLARGRGTIGDASNDIMAYGPPIDISVEQGLATIFCPLV